MSLQKIPHDLNINNCNNVELLNIDSRIRIGKAINQNIKMLLHCNGSNGSTSFTDEIGRTLTGVNATNSITQYKFGTASAYFANNGYITVPIDDTIQFGSGDFSIDFWMYPTEFEGSGIPDGLFYYGNSIDYYKGVLVRLSDTNIVLYIFQENGVSDGIYSPSITATNTWYHIACFRKAGYLGIAVNGTIVASKFSSVSMGVPDTSPVARIGCELSSGYYYSGYIDEFRILKGRHPFIPGQNFIVPIKEHSLYNYNNYIGA